MMEIYELQKYVVDYSDIRGKCFSVVDSVLYSTLEKAQTRGTIDHTVEMARHGTIYPEIEWTEIGPCKYKGFQSQEFPDHYYRILIKVVL